MPSNAGGVSVKLRLDDRDALKDLASLREKIESLNASLNQKRSQRNSVLEEMNKADRRAEQARFSVEKLKAALASAPAGEKAGIRAQLTEANEELRIATSEAARVDKELKKIDASIATGEQNVQKMEEQAGNLVKQVEASNSAMAKLESASAQAAGKMEKAFERLGRMLRRVFVFTVVTKALREIREYLQDVLMSTPDFAAAFGQFKGALLTLVQPILHVLIPALTRLMQIITAVVTALAGLVSKVFGMSLQQSKDNASALYDQASAYKATGSAAKKAANQLAAFDQLNILQDNSSSNNGGGTTTLSGQPSFEFGDLGEDKLRNILDLVTLIGAGLLGWKVSDAFGLGLQGAIGIALILWGTLKLVRGYLDAWDEGVSADNLKDLLLGLTALAIGLGLVFDAVGAGIGLLLGGIALFVLGIKDIIGNGLNLENMLLTIGALLAAGIGIGLITGLWVPLLIAAILAALLALVYFTGHGGELVQGLRDIFEGFVNFMRGLFTRDMGLAVNGLNQMGLGLEETYLSVIESIEDGFLNFFEILDKLTGGIFSPIIDYWRNEFEDTVTFWKDSLNGFLLFFEGVFTFDWGKAWDGLKSVAAAFINRMVSMIENAANFVIDGLNKIKIGGKSVFEINRIKLPRVEDVAGGNTIADDRNSGGRTNDGAFRGKADGQMARETEDIAGTTENIYTGISDILSEMKSLRERGGLQRTASTTDWSKLADTSGSGSLGIENLLGKISGMLYGEDWGAELQNIANGAVLPISQEFSVTKEDLEASIAAENGKTAEVIAQMGNLILAAIQNQELTAYMDSTQVSRALYSPMQIVAKNRGAALVGG